MKRSFQRKFIITNTLLMVLFVASITFLFIYDQTQALSKITIAHSMAANELFAQRIGKNISQHINQLKYIASGSNQETTKTSSILKDLKDMQKNAGTEFIDIFYADHHMNYQALSGNSGVINDRDFIQQLSHGHLDHIISQPLLEQYDNMPAVLIVVPIKNTQKEVTGLLGGLVSLDTLAGDFKSIKHSGNSYGWLIDGEGLVLGHPNSKYPLKIMIQDTDDAGYPGLSAIGREMLQSDFGYGEYHDTLLDVQKIVTYVKIPYTNNWKLAITTFKSDIYAPLHAVIYRALIFSLIALVLFNFIITKAAKHNLQPLDKLVNVMDLASRLEFRTVQAQTDDDIVKNVYKAYNEMIEKIKKYTLQLEKTLDERTEELKTISGHLNERTKRILVDSDALDGDTSRDPLTRLLKPGPILNEIESSIRDVRMNLSPYFSVTLIELSNYGFCYEAYGTKSGDEMVKAFASHLKRTFRSTDIIGRYSENQFVVILTNTSEKNASFALHNLNVSLKETGPYIDQLVESCPESLSIAIGLASFSPGDDRNSNDLIHEAQTNLNEMKQIKKSRDAH